MKLLNFSNILLVVVCASLGYMITSFVIKNNTIQYATQKQTFTRVVHDYGDETGHSIAVFKFKVESKFKADSLATKKIKITKEKDTYLYSNGFIYHQNPTLLVWSMLISIMMSIAAGSVPVFLGLIRQLKQKFELNRGQLLIAWIYAIILGAVLIFSNVNLPGYYKPEYLVNQLHILFTSGNLLLWIVISTVILILPAFALVFTIGVSSDNIVLVQKDLKNIENSVRKLRHLHESLQKALQILSVIVVFSVLTSSFLGQSIKSTINIKGFDLYPEQVSYVYGMYFTVFLCILYVPVYYYIKYHYNNLKELAMELDLDDNHAENDIYHKLFGDSQFESSPLANIKLALTLLAPILSGFLPAGMKVLG